MYVWGGIEVGCVCSSVVGVCPYDIVVVQWVVCVRLW
jgi:hypothetical protein